jgi:hypothetical protein
MALQSAFDFRTGPNHLPGNGQFYRLEQLEKQLGIPLPAATQWEHRANARNSIFAGRQKGGKRQHKATANFSSFKRDFEQRPLMASKYDRFENSRETASGRGCKVYQQPNRQFRRSQKRHRKATLGNANLTPIASTPQQTTRVKRGDTDAPSSTGLNGCHAGAGSFRGGGGTVSRFGVDRSGPRARAERSAATSMMDETRRCPCSSFSTRAALAARTSLSIRLQARQPDLDGGGLRRIDAKQ